MRLRRRHPSERALRRWGQLSPELRELVARAARSVAKDAVQELMQAQGLPYKTPEKPEVIRDTNNPRFWTPGNMQAFREDPTGQ